MERAGGVWPGDTILTLGTGSVSLFTLPEIAAALEYYESQKHFSRDRIGQIMSSRDVKNKSVSFVNFVGRQAMLGAWRFRSEQ